MKKMSFISHMLKLLHLKNFFYCSNKYRLVLGTRDRPDSPRVGAEVPWDRFFQTIIYPVKYAVF